MPRPVLGRQRRRRLPRALFLNPAEVDDLAHPVIVPRLDQEHKMGSTIDLQAADGHTSAPTAPAPASAAWSSFRRSSA